MNKRLRTLLSDVASGRGADLACRALARELLAPRKRTERERAAVKAKGEKRLTKREETALLRAELYALTGGCCERCGQPVSISLGHMHHTLGGSGKRRQLQAIGNVAWLCYPCHATLHDNPAMAKAWGERLRATRAKETSDAK